METSPPSCVSMRRYFWSICSLLPSIQGTLRQNLQSDYTVKTNAQSCIWKWTTSSALCLSSGQRWRGDLGAGQGSRGWDCVAKAGATCERAWLCWGAKTKRIPKENFGWEGRIDFTEKRSSFFKVQREKNVSADKDKRKKKGHTQHTKSKTKY